MKIFNVFLKNQQFEEKYHQLEYEYSYTFIWQTSRRKENNWMLGSMNQRDAGLLHFTKHKNINYIVIRF